MVNRRKFLASAAALLSFSTVPVWGQSVLNNAGKAIVSGSGHVIEKPSAPVIPTAFSTPIKLTNPAGQPTQSDPFVSFGMPLGRGDFFDATQKLAIYDQTGNVKITDCQIDMISRGWRPDGSVNQCALAGYLPGTSLPPGVTGNFMLRGVPGSAPTTPVCTFAQLAAQNDIKAVCKIGTDTFTVSLKDIAAAQGGSPVTYPQTYLRQWKSGPYICDWAAGGYLKRTDGAFHRWAFLKLYIGALGVTGPFIVRGYLEDVQLYGANPLGTVGTVATDAPPVVVDSIEVFNGATFICAIGGVNDLNSATFSPSNVSIATAGVTPTFQGGLKAGDALTVTPRNPIGFVPSAGGTLPGGLEPASTTTYWAAIDPSNRAGGTVIPCTSRLFATRIVWAGFVKMAPPVAGTVVAANKWIYSNGGVYYSSTAGASTGAQPTGAVFADSSKGGALVWTLISAQITSAGTGTHTMTMKAAISGASKVPLMGPDTYPFWSGAGSLPKLVIGYDRTYIIQKTKSVPPLDPSIVPTAWVGAFPRYVQNMTYLPGNQSLFYIGDGGEATMDERINLFSPTALASICLPTDAGMAVACRAMSLSFLDREVSWRDERTQEIPVVNYGPNRDGASTYPQMAPLNTTLVINSQSVTGSPARIRFSGWNGYGGGYFDNQTADSAHTPHIHYWPALTSGDPLFYDASIELASYALAQAGVSPQIRSAVLNGVTMTTAWPLFEQVRGQAHTLKIFSQCEWICPDAHPAKPYFSDVMDDSAVFGTLWTDAHIGPNGHAVGYIPSAIAIPAPNAVYYEPWMMGYLQIAMLGEVLKGNRPGFKAFLQNYLWKAYLPLWDSDVGGSEQLVDAQWTVVATGSEVMPPAEANYMLTSANRMAGNPVIFQAYQTIPPPTQLFVNGLGTGGRAAYVYRTGAQAFTGNAYGLTCRAVCEMGAMAGIPGYAKIADRINAFSAANYTVLCSWTLQGAPGPGAPTGTSPGNNNGLMYAMKRQ